MSARLLLISTDRTVASAVGAAIDAVTSLMQIDHWRDAAENYTPDAILVDSDVRAGVETAFEKIGAIKKRFATTPVIVLGNEMSAPLVLAALRAGAHNFLDRAADSAQIRAAIDDCLAQSAPSRLPARAKMGCVLNALPGELDQDFALNLALRAAMRTSGQMCLYIDLSVPAAGAGIALGLDLDFAVPDAIREIARLDGALLDSALARDAQSGLYLMPLCAGSETPVLEAAAFAALLEILRSLCDVIIVNYGPFSRQKALLEMARPAQFFLCCNQRFASIHQTQALLRWFGDEQLGSVPEIVVHEMARGLTPSPSDIRHALKIAHSIDIATSWSDLAEQMNQAKPGAYARSAYSRGLDLCLTHMGIALEPEPDFAQKLRGWLRLTLAEAS
ncbi:MAG: hypothetical protein ACTHPD_09845 [Rhizomicrobium sp.]